MYLGTWKTGRLIAILRLPSTRRTESGQLVTQLARLTQLTLPRPNRSDRHRRQGTDIAIAKSGAAAYQAVEKACVAQYHSCGCASMPTVAEVGRVALSNNPVVPVC